MCKKEGIWRGRRGRQRKEGEGGTPPIRKMSIYIGNMKVKFMPVLIGILSRVKKVDISEGTSATASQRDDGLSRALHTRILRIHYGVAILIGESDNTTT